MKFREIIFELPFKAMNCVESKNGSTNMAIFAMSFVLGMQLTAVSAVLAGTIYFLFG